MSKWYKAEISANKTLHADPKNYALFVALAIMPKKHVIFRPDELSVSSIKENDMELLNKTESEIVEIVTPIAKSMAEAWSNDDYKSFTVYFEKDKKGILTEDDFKTQRSWVAEELGSYTINEIESIHQNPTNVVITWKVSFSNRSELGLGIYRFKEINNEINVTSCIYFN